MALSPNYEWAEPDNSSLVKNGAQDIRALGDAIDTSVWNVGYGQAAKNKIINGDFAINQRAFTSVTTSATYCYDRWKLTKVGSDGTTTITPQTFTVGAAPVAGYEGINFLRIATTGQTDVNTASIVAQSIEDVRTFAGQTVTVSFWAKAATGTPKVAIELEQAFGTGGSSAVLNYAGQVTISTSWARYTGTVAIPSISGKTIGTASRVNLNLWTSGGSTYDSRTGSMGIQTATIDFWGVQVEYGSQATPFQTASGGSPQAELAMCQRYYVRWTGGAAYHPYGLGFATSTTAASVLINAPVQMRVAPTAIEYSTIYTEDYAGTSSTAGTPALANTGPITTRVNLTGLSGMTAGRGVYIFSNNDANGYLAFTAEL